VNGLIHKIGGIVFCTETNTSLPLLSGTLFTKFSIPDVKPDVRHRLYKVTLDGEGLTEPIEKKARHLSKWFDLPTDWLKSSILRSRQVCDRLAAFEHCPEGTVVRIDDHYVLIRDFSSNQMEILYSKGLEESTPEHRPDMLGSEVLANFREIFSAFLPSFDATLLHCSGVIRENTAALFLAPGGGGKTTVAAQANGHPVLSDDQVILRQEEGLVLAHSTPLGGMTSGPCRARVGAFFLLEKASCFQLDPITRAELVQWLWSEHRRFTGSLTNALKKTVFEVFCAACYGVPVYRMRFSKDFVDWAAIDAAMGKKRVRIHPPGGNNNAHI
jgi:hypothetical protein